MKIESIKAAALAASAAWPSGFEGEAPTPIGRHIDKANPAAVLEMCAEIERLQSLATTAMEQHDIVGRLYQESVKEIERLHEEIRTEQRLSCREQVGIQQVEIERLTAEVNEQAQLLGGGVERELRMRAVMQQALDALKQLDGIDTETECVAIAVADEIAAIQEQLK